MGDELKDKILIHNGIIASEIEKEKPSILNCPRCDLINAFENKYCSKCNYELKAEAFEKIKTSSLFEQLNQVLPFNKKELEKLKSFRKYIKAKYNKAKFD